ncbi:MAG TPA: CheR family methyltransferase [Myxococcales bacterium]|nr:CheR family methyltransferase [Myxococcales bacterium]
MSDAFIERLVDYAAEWTGFSHDAILPDQVKRAAAQLGEPEDVLRRAAAGERRVVHALCQAVSVGETFFFRQPEHFRTIASTLLPELMEQRVPAVRAWSAGCATGEEPYSLAACLLDLLPPGIAVEVLGTDLLERNLAAARAGVYGAWSQRPSAPMLHQLFHPVAGERVAVDERVRAATRFAEHNLLTPAPGEFEIVFCRNVLVYFSPQAASAAVRHLAAAVAPGGALFFGSMDVGEPPPGLVAMGPPELQIFRRTDARAAKRPPPPLPPRTTTPFPPLKRPPEPVALHLRALVHIERGEKKRAEAELGQLAREVPDYVPGILERALLHVRLGERGAAASLMREVLRRTEKLPADELLAGPEPLPVSFYRDSAQTFLRGGQP